VKEAEIFLEDASRLPPSPVKVPVRRLSFPFPGGFEQQNIFNNYQQPTDDYVHAGLDILQPPGTEVRAVDEGWVTVIATNYPEWKTHHLFVVSPDPGASVGWCYTHLDPDAFTFRLGDRITRGQVLGKVVDFYVGEHKGADHLHLHYVRVDRLRERGADLTSLVDPLLFFDWEDTEAPVVHGPLRFVRAGTLDELPFAPDGPRTLSGEVDVIAGISDVARPGQGCNWMVPVVTLEITGKDVAPWRKLVLDQRGEIAQPRAAPALYVKGSDGRRWLEQEPPFPPIHLVVATHSDGDGVLEEADALQTWNTAEQDARGERRFPDGLYEVRIRTWDLKGNLGQRAETVRVENR